MKQRVLLTLRPFRVGDFIETQGYSGTVKAIGIFHTTLTTGDNKTVILPNAPVANDPLVNFTSQDRRRVELTIGIGYGDDIDQARGIIRRLIDADERIMQDPEPVIAVSALADSSVNFIVRAWTSTGDYCMNGITRANVIKLCRDNGIPVFERNYSLVDTYGADEAFLTGTFGAQTPVGNIDGREIGDGQLGPITKRLRALYKDLIKTEIAG